MHGLTASGHVINELPVAAVCEHKLYAFMGLFAASLLLAWVGTQLGYIHDKKLSGYTGQF